MKIRWFLFILFAALLSQQASGFATNLEDEQQALYSEARKYCIKHEWNKAIASLQDFNRKYPQSHYADDVAFWLGYCLENLPGREKEAFEIFEGVASDNPDSRLVDDARIHQIELAEKFAGQGETTFRDFLEEQLQADSTSVRYRAAISLGKLGDDAALPVLRNMQEDENLGRIAASLVAELEGRAGHADFTPSENEPDKPGFLSTKRYKHYKLMLRKDDAWTWPELKSFGLWHILPDDEFERYFSLKHEYDREQWYEQYWPRLSKKLDVEANLLRNEFERRVLYARAHFSKTASHKSSRYLADSYLIAGRNRAPWDARGELYVKYGEPRVRYLYGVFTEHWEYPQYDIDFVVRQFMTNIRLDAIGDGPVLNGIYEDRLRFQEAFLLNQEFLYNRNYQFDELENFAAQVKSPAFKRGKTQVAYTLAPQELEKLPLESQQQGAVLFTWQVVNQNQNEVLQREQLRFFPAGKVGKNLGGQFELDLQPGKYTLIFEAQDMAGYKHGLYKKDFEVLD